MSTTTSGNTALGNTIDTCPVQQLPRGRSGIVKSINLDQVVTNQLLNLGLLQEDRLPFLLQVLAV